jgi:hypothetical protein
MRNFEVGDKIVNVLSLKLCILGPYSKLTPKVKTVASASDEFFSPYSVDLFGSMSVIDKLKAYRQKNGRHLLVNSDLYLNITRTPERARQYIGKLFDMKELDSGLILKGESLTIEEEIARIEEQETDGKLMSDEHLMILGKLGLL